MDIGNQQRVIIVETEELTAVEPDVVDAAVRLEDIADEEWPLPVDIDPAPGR